MPKTKIGSRWSSGDLIFYEKDVSLGTIGEVLKIGDDAVTVGSATNDIDLKVFLGSSTEYVLFDVGNSRVHFGEDDQGVDVKLFGDTSGAYLEWDTSSDVLNIVSKISGGSADNGVDLTVDDSSTPASGYAHGFHVAYNKSGVDTGSGISTMQFNAIGADVTISGAGGGTAGYYSLYTYVAKSGTPDLSGCGIFGANLEMTEMGATDYFGGLWLNKYNTTKGTSIDAFILMSNQDSGVTRTCFYVQGDKPDYFLQTANLASDGFLDAGTTAGDQCIGHLKVYLGTTTGYINVFSDNS